MASKSPDQRHSATHTTLAPFQMGWRLAKTGVLLWIFCVAANITWVRWNHLEPDLHMPKLIDYYLSGSTNVEFMAKVTEKLYWAAFEATELQRSLTSPPSAEQTLGKATRRVVWASFKNDFRVAAYATILFGIKVALLMLVAPLVICLLLAAGIDGLVQRYIRTACGGNESSAIYHRAKLYGMTFLPPLAATIFMASPVAFDPAFVVLPAAIGSAILLRIQVTYYKKYL